MITQIEPDTHTTTREPRVTFWGAVQSVSGSMHLLETGDHKILIDCGLHQGRREEVRARNGRFPFHPRQIDALIVSHAHVDHTGNVPTLVRQGFAGPIYCTPATRDLIAVMLADSARIQEEDAAHINHARGFAEPQVPPLYTQADVDETLARVVAVPYNRPQEVVRNVRFRLINSGHIIGAAMVHVEVEYEGRTRTLTYTGDLGRRDMPMLRPTAAVPPADVVVCESTYGGRTHEPFEKSATKLWDVVRTTLARGGKALIPSFSLGRAQLIVHYLRQGIRSGQLPDFPVYVDSPLAADVADIYRSHTDCLRPELELSLKDDPEFLGSADVHYVRSFEESLRLSTRKGPCVIVASSGMCDAGRIVEHLKHNVDDPRCTVILVSFQAAGTTGRRLLEPKPTVRFLNRDWNKWADVVKLDGFSGHADQEDFRTQLAPLVGKVGKIRLVHGEREQAEALARALREMGFDDVGIPGAGETVVLG